MIKPSNKHLTFILLVIILIGAFFRLTNSLEHLTFWGDSLRDIIATQKIWNAITEFKLDRSPIQGPQVEPIYNISSYHGAFYYYLIFIPAVLTNFHPYSIALFVIITNILCIWLIFLCTKKIFDIPTALLSAFLLAISSFAILYSRFPWNPNLIIFFSLLSIISYLNIIDGKKNYWSLWAFSAAATTQIHLLGYIFVTLAWIPSVLYLIITAHNYPKRWLIISTIFFFLLPFVPTIMNEVISDLSLVRGSLNYISIHSNYSLSNFSSLILSLQTVLGINLPSMLIALLLISILMIHVRFRLMHQFKRYEYFFLVCWAVSVVIIIFISKFHIYRQIYHPLLFSLPLLLIFYAALIRSSFRSKSLYPIGVILFTLFIYSNFNSNIKIINSPDKALPPPIVLLKDLILVSTYIETENKDYELEINDPLVVYPAVWVIDKYFILQPTKVNGRKDILMPLESPYNVMGRKEAKRKYIISSKRSSTIQKISSSCIKTREMFSLSVYQCDY